MATSMSLAALTLVLMTPQVTSHPVKVVDLTNTLGDDALFWPGQPPFNYTYIHDGIWVPGVWVTMGALSLGEHGGTHIDTPAHFIREGQHSEEVPPSHLVGPGVVVDVSHKVESNDMYALTVQDLTDWEKEHGQIPQGAVLLVNCGWGVRYPNASRYFNTDTVNDSTTFRFPGLSGEAAKWLVDNRNLTALGVDTASPDLPNDTTYPVHVALLTRNIIIIENTANLDSLPAKGFEVIIGLIKVRGGTGGAARVLALMDRGGTSSAATATAAGPFAGDGARHLWGRFFLGLVGIFVTMVFFGE